MSNPPKDFIFSFQNHEIDFHSTISKPDKSDSMDEEKEHCCNIITYLQKHCIMQQKVTK